MEKLILIDGSGLIYRGFYAVPPFMRSPAGVQTNAVFGFVNILFTLLSKHKPDYIAIAFDKKGPTFRHKQYTEYKATRVKAPDELYAQIPIVKDLVSTFKIPSFEVEGFEADDILATIVEMLKDSPGVQIQIATGDFDMFQLISDQVSILYPAKSFKEPEIFKAEHVQAKYGIAPSQVVDYKALRGDSSDNIPGVKGIGPKTALTLLDKYKTLDDVYRNLSSVTPESVKNKLEQDRANAFMSKELATLHNGVPMNFDLKACHLSAFDVPSIMALFDHLGFKSFQKRLNEILPRNGNDTNKTAVKDNTPRGSNSAPAKDEQTSMF